MLKPNRSITAFVLGASLALCSLTPAFADDSEIYVGSVSTVKPNILLLIDTSFSMDTRDATDDHATFDPTQTYGTVAGCDDTKIFYTVGAGATEPTCASTQYISSDNTTYQFCDKLYQATRAASSAPSGRWTGKAGQFNTTTLQWEDIKPNGVYGKIECMADRAVHGSAAGVWYARNGSSANPWSSNVANEINWSQRATYTFYSARWVKWNAQPATPVTMSRIQAVKNAVYDMVSSIDDVNIGVMRFNDRNGSAAGGTDPEYQGGVVTNAIGDVTNTRNTIINSVRNFNTNSATPLSEMMYEAGQYWAGGRAEWGNNGSADSNAISGGVYNSPITESCQRNFNILLTDGRPTWDNQDDANIEALYNGTCTGQPGEPNSGPDTGNPPDSRNAGRCLDEMTTYLARDTTDLRTSLSGNQKVKTFTIGFGGDDPAAFDFLTEVATDGGGVRYLANNVAGLNRALTDIATQISNISATFTTGSIGINSFNRAQTATDMYFSVFNSDDHLKWDGNLKKYKLGRGVDPDGAGPQTAPFVIEGQTAGVSAVDPLTGFFKDTSQSFWSTTVDGNKVTEGGAASKLPAAASRTVLTHIGNNPAGNFANMVAIDDTSVTDTILGTNATAPTRADVIAFAKGGATKRMGDPLHTTPQVVTYAGTATSPVDVVYVATNDGYLHAIDASTGIEKWSFIPQELLARLKTLVVDPAATTRTYGLDGEIRILKFDVNGDGDVDTADGDVVWLFVGMRRGGNYYYALDITNRNAPKLMWKISPTEMPGMGETWSPPSLARVLVSGKTQNNQRIVLIFGGGYDGQQENYTQVADNFGNNIFMVDAKFGTLLWSAGNNNTHDLNLAAMTNSIPGRISVIDFDGDGYADRMYAADLGGRIFRFDIFSGNPASSLVTGSVFAKMGNGTATGGNDSPSPNSSTRRFYSAPDVALIQHRGADPYYNVAIGSGYRGHPLYRNNLDRFYVLRDKQPKMKFTINNALTPITEATAGLVDVTSNPAASTVNVNSIGWKYVFDPTNAQTGEKVLNESLTVNGLIRFTTYIPQAASATDPCRPKSVNRVYAFNAENGRPMLDLNNDGVVDNNDVFETLPEDTIVGPVTAAVVRNPDGTVEPPCPVGMHIVNCGKVGDVIRTYWRKDVDQ